MYVSYIHTYTLPLQFLYDRINNEKYILWNSHTFFEEKIMRVSYKSRISSAPPPPNPFPLETLLTGAKCDPVRFHSNGEGEMVTNINIVGLVFNAAK
jgi:hypothetical protein